jgi:undecaprenyl-diphosphatase
LSDWIKAVVLGIVQGITEYIPVSSSGHMIVGESILDFHPNLRVTFAIFIQVGAVFGLIAFYNTQLRRHFRTFHRDPDVRRLWLAILIALIPSAVLGLLLHSVRITWFRPGVVMTSMIVGGALIVVAEFIYRHNAQVHVRDEKLEIALVTVTFRQAFVVGLAQILALIPGMSRSATTIIGGMLGGMNRQAATHFSFLLAIPTLIGATLVQLLSVVGELEIQELGLLVVGTVVSGVVGWVVVRWLIRYVANNTLTPFGIYAVILGVVLFLVIGVT